MKCSWIIENFTHESSYDELVEELKKQNIPFTMIKGGYKHSDLDEFREGNPCVVFLGSIEMTECRPAL